MFFATFVKQREVSFNFGEVQDFSPKRISQNHRSEVLSQVFYHLLRVHLNERFKSFADHDLIVILEVFEDSFFRMEILSHLEMSL